MENKQVSKERHSQEFREHVIQDFLEHPEMTYDDLCRKYEIADHSIIAYWVKQYIEENSDPLSLIREIRALKHELQSVKEDMANLLALIDTVHIHSDSESRNVGTDLSTMEQVFEDVKALCNDDPMMGSFPQALWIDSLKISQLNDSEVILKCTSEFHGGVVETNYSDILQAKFEKVLGHPVALHFIWANEFE